MSLTVNHLRLTSAEDVHELFRLLDYDVYDPAPFEDDELDEVLELDEGDRPAVQRAYIVADQGGHVVWLFEVDDTRLVRLRGLAHNALQRGSALVIVTKPDYKEVIFADPRYAGNPVKSNVRVSKLQVLTADPTRHDADTLNLIHARNRTGQQIYDAQAEAFNVEKTTRKFYREYHTFYERARDLTVQYNPHIREFHDPDKLHAFVQRLLGRLMFLYFLQRKGWLGGERNFLSRMFVLTYRQHADEIGDNDESFYYYREVLEPLFFETMNTKRPDNITKWEGIRIPYLNGGLFDAGRDPSGIISLPDSLFDPNSSEGVLAFFNRYNFTVADDTPLEQDVAVDPEMLGKVFENLLEERDRGQSGSFYTPRAIVSYMCQEALAGYLEEALTPLTPKSPLPQQVEERGLDTRERWSISPEMHKRMTDIARQLRQKSTPGEDILWQALRNRKLDGRKFKRQVDIGAFVVDFYCAAERLVVEVDGPIHDQQQEADRKRQEMIESLGIRFVRVTNQQVAEDLPATLDKIRAAFLQDTSDNGDLLPSPREAVGEGLGVRDTIRTLFNPDSAADLTPEQATAINAALDTLTVLDPAVGSGSFLIGMMNEILTLKERCYEALTPKSPLPQQAEERGLDTPSPREAVGEGLGVREKRLADWKEHIIGHTLYGVDIKPEAIEIAQLRLWLALVVNQTIADARPLPNLDYKLMAGNSLIETIDGEPVLTEAAMQQFTGDDVDWQYVDAQMSMFRPNPQQARMALFDDEKQAQAERVKLGEMRREFFRATPERRRQLRADITAQERAIIAASLNSRLTSIREQITALEKKAAQAGGKWSKADASKRAKLEERAARVHDALRELDKPEPSLPFFLYRLHFSEIFERKGGFDVVVANPPYVRQELIKDQKPELQVSYKDVYAGTADLFVYFFARAFNLLHRNGQLSFITPNKFMRANYGKALRKFLAEKVTLHTLIDFGDLPIFDATTYPMITIARKENPLTPKSDTAPLTPKSPLPQQAKAALTPKSPLPHQAEERRLDTPSPRFSVGEGAGGEGHIRVLHITDLRDTDTLHAAADRAFLLPQSTLSEDGWQLSAPEVRRVMDKLKAAGVPLGEYVDGKIYYGIKTGLNEAFVIDSAKRDELIAADPKSADVIKPYLRGRDVKRWVLEGNGLYMLYIPWEFDIENYPAVFEHLKGFKEKLSARPEVKDGRFAWYALSRYGSEYVDEFEKPKIVFPAIVNQATFAFDSNYHYSNDKTTIIVSDDSYLLAVLNSSVQDFFFGQIAATRANNYFEQKPMYIEQIPIPDAPPPLRDQIADLARQCLAAAALTPKSPLPQQAEERGLDTPSPRFSVGEGAGGEGALPALEARLNALVYQAYGLDADDIAVIEGHLGE